MAQYLVLIYEDEASWESAGTETFERVLVKHRRFGEDNVAALRGGNALQPTSMATSLRKDAAGGLTVNRRGVREDYGGAWWVLPDRGGRLGPGAGGREAGASTLRWR